MFILKSLTKILFLLYTSSFSAFAETGSSTVENSLYRSLNSQSQQELYKSFKDKSLKIKPAKTPRIKLRLVFTPEDLIIPTDENIQGYYREDQIAVDQDSDRILGFYIKTFF